MDHMKQIKPFKLEVTPSSPYALASGNTHLFVQLKITGTSFNQTKQRNFLNLGIVLDRSGSMRGEKLQKAKEAVEFIVKNLTKTDIFSLTVYDHLVENLIASGVLTSQTLVISKIRNIRDRGRTNLYGGILEGVNQVEMGKNKEFRNIILLLTDGLANEGITDKLRIKSGVEEIYNEGIGISTFGVGEDFDEDLLVTIADSAGGTYYFIETADDIPKYIAQEFEGLLDTVAYNLEVHWKGIEGLKINRVLGVPYESRFSNSTKLGDLQSEKEIILIFDVIIPPKTLKDSKQKILDFTISWIPTNGLPKEEKFHSICEIIYTEDEELLSQEVDEIIENAHLLEAVFIHQEVIDFADQGQFSNAQKTMNHFQQKLQERIVKTGGSQILEKLQSTNARILSDMLNEESYSKLNRKKMTSTMYSIRKQNQ